ncbi:rhodanese-like domain-containing protein [Rhizobiaceae bacterium]|nr:rhodanese-like domain-containing protein [Rhizobiaceae bacterium]
MPHVLRALLVLAALLISSSSLHAAEVISVEDAHARALEKRLLLVDIRTPDEWADTGVPASARPITMHEADFLTKLDAAANGRKDAPIGLICAVGGRSAYLSAYLEQQGYTNIIDVSEGMNGSARGSGWLAKGLPVVQPKGN